MSDVCVGGFGIFSWAVRRTGRNSEYLQRNINHTPNPRRFPELSLLFQLPPAEEMLIYEPCLFLPNKTIEVFGVHSARDFKDLKSVSLTGSGKQLVDLWREQKLYYDSFTIKFMQFC